VNIRELTLKMILENLTSLDLWLVCRFYWTTGVARL